MSSDSPICQRCHNLYISKNKTNMCPKCLEERFLERGKDIAALESQLQAAQEDKEKQAIMVFNNIVDLLAQAQEVKELVAQLQAENEALRADNAALRNALQTINCIGEKYEEKPYGTVKFTPSLESVKRFAGDVLRETDAGASLLSELEGLRDLQTIATDVMNWLKKNGYGGTGHARCLEDALNALSAVKGGS